MSAPTFTLDVLAVACSESDSMRPALMAPMAIEIGGEAWTVATNGHRLLAVRHDYSAAPAPEGFATTIGTMCRDAFAPGGMVLPLAPFREFFATHAPPPLGACPECNGRAAEDCEECEGAGEIECECLDCGDEHTKKCKTCWGTGGWTCSRCSQPEKKVPVRVGVAVFDARTMAPVIAVLPDGDARLHQQGPARMTTIAGDDWFACMMPLSSDKYRGAPDFQFSAEVSP